MTLFDSSLTALSHGYVSLEELSKQPTKVETEEDGGNPFLVPHLAERIIQDHHNAMGWAWSYGGYGENRSKLWHGIKYMQERGTFLHLGVDFNVPAGTRVYMTRPATVVKIDSDTERFGWGPRIVVRLKHQPLYLIFAHLDRNISCRQGSELKRNEMIGQVGRAPHNGDWFAHLHVQAMAEEKFRHLEAASWDELDGYGKVEDRAKLLRAHPDPLRFVRVWK